MHDSGFTHRLCNTPFHSSIHPSSPTFQCPQQKKKKIPLSRLNDGVCDCCDGADETDGLSTCGDICDKVLAEERAAREKALKDFEVGSQKRKAELAAFDVLVKETMAEIDKAELGLKEKEQELEGVSKEVHAARLAYAESRRSELTKIVDTASSSASDQGGISGLLGPLTNDEIGQLIQLTCQLSGEMEGSTKERTCVPLRLAGVDAGILWTDEAFANATAEVINMGDESARQLVAELVYMNSQGEKAWTEKKANKNKEKRRRLDEHYPDDDYHHYDQDDEDDFGDDDYHDEEEEEEETVEPDVEDEKGEEINKVKAVVEGSLFSRPRRKFLTHADGLLAKVDAFLKTKEDEAEAKEKEEKEGEAAEVQSDGKEEEAAEPADEAVEEEPAFDPMAYNIVKSSLKKRQQAIRRGLQYAVSGRILVDAVSKNSDANKARSDLISLAVGTLMHSQASTEHVWLVLNSVLPEFASDSNDESQTCASPLATICPAKTIERKGVQYPPTDFITAGTTACSRAVDEINAAGCVEQASDEIPTNISNGYYGYDEVKPREEGDLLQSVFAALRDLEPTQLTELENKERLLESDKSSLTNQVKSLEDKIGGRGEHDTLKSELHALKNACLTVTEGKYDYEVCIYGRATQKDKGHKTGGTGLGSWEGMSFDEETGHRVMKWEKGQQCWNGPARSATVIVTCGAETSLLSAEEPDTCQYLLEMESHIACDDAYFQKFLS